MRVLFVPLLAVSLAGCANSPLFKGSGQSRTDAPIAQDADGQLRPQSRPGALEASAAIPVVSAQTPEQFDTTTAEERLAAASAPEDAGGEKLLGETVASLGDPTKPGFWLETPLVSKPTIGRVHFAGSGKSAQVDLIPIDGPPTAGSRISLAAMRLIDAPLTDLPTLQVFAND